MPIVAYNESVMLEKSGKNRFIIATAFVFLLVLANIFSSQTRNIFYNFSLPLQKVFWQVGNGLSPLFARNKEAKMHQEIENLKIEKSQLAEKIVALTEKEKENVQLREALSAELNKEFNKLLVAGAFGLATSKDALFIDKGARNGAKEGMPVISAQKVLYGQITVVDDRYSIVRLLSNKESSVAVKIIQGEDTLTGAVKGSEDGIFLDLIPRDKELKEGSLIITLPLGGYPEGLLVGLVGRRIQNDTSPFQQAKVQAFFKQDPRDYLFVLLDF